MEKRADKGQCRWRKEQIGKGHIVEREDARMEGSDGG